MKLEQQVCSLELAQKLKELGVKQNSLFSYKTYLIKKHNTGIPEIMYHAGFTNRKEPETLTNLQLVSAFTVAELGEMLPARIDAKSKKDGRKTIAYFLEYHAGGLSVQYIHHLDTRQVLWEEAENTEADARAKMLIYLIENNLLSTTPQG
jgi:hypothetical protein